MGSGTKPKMVNVAQHQVMKYLQFTNTPIPKLHVDHKTQTKGYNNGKKENSVVTIFYI